MNTVDRISFLHVPTEAEVTPDIARLWGKAQVNLGFVLNDEYFALDRT